MSTETASGPSEQFEVLVDVAKALFQEHLETHGEIDVGESPGFSAARAKLAGLEEQQFQELVTDVYDELLRRNNSMLPVPFDSLGEEEYKAKRHKPRQKLTSLVDTQFANLISDLVAELDRRYTSFIESAVLTDTIRNPRQPISFLDLRFSLQPPVSRPEGKDNDRYQRISEFSVAGPDLFPPSSVPLTISGYQRAFATASRFCLNGGINRFGMHPMAAGGYADVWKGTLGTLLVAIKIMRPFEGTGGRIHHQKLFKRLWREFLSWSSLSHENIIPCLGFSYDFCSGPDAVPALISPWMSNGTVSSYVEKNPDISIRLKLLSGIAEGISYLHHREPAIIHGDLRAGNVLVNDSGIACLSDFGLSKILSENRGMTTSSEVAGSLRWMAPELIRDASATVTVNSDIWAYGMTALEILSGARPYHTVKNEVAVFGLILNGEVPSRPDEQCMSKEMWTICHKCWQRSPTTRPPIRTVTALVSAIASDLGHRIGEEPKVWSPERNKYPGMARMDQAEEATNFDEISNRCDLAAMEPIIMPRIQARRGPAHWRYGRISA